MNPGSSTTMVDLVWDINCDRPGAPAKPLCQSHGQVFPTLMRLWPLLKRLSGVKAMKNALLLYSLFLLLLFCSFVILLVPRLQMLHQVSMQSRQNNQPVLFTSCQHLDRVCSPQSSCRCRPQPSETWFHDWLQLWILQLKERSNIGSKKGSRVALFFCEYLRLFFMTNEAIEDGGRTKTFRLSKSILSFEIGYGSLKTLSYRKIPKVSQNWHSRQTRLIKPNTPIRPITHTRIARLFGSVYLDINRIKSNHHLRHNEREVKTSKKIWF